jgi:hypothetical protein
MSVHDIVTECAKYSLLECQDLSNREEMICSNLVHSSTVFILLSFSGFILSYSFECHLQCALEPVIVSAAQPAPWLDEAMNVAGEWTWPAQWVPQGPASTKAPLSARVTPKPDPTESFLKQQQAASIPPSSSVARTLSLTPTASPLPLPPTSPMKKDLHSFKFPGAGVVVGATGEHDRRSTVIGVKLQKIGQEPASNSFAHFGPVLSGMRSRHSSGAPSADPRKNLMSPSTLLQTDPLSPAQLANKPTDKVTVTLLKNVISQSFLKLILNRIAIKLVLKIGKCVVYCQLNPLPKISKRKLTPFLNRGSSHAKERPVLCHPVDPTVYFRYSSKYFNE